MPNLAIADAIVIATKGKAKITYFGSYRGVENELIQRTGLPYQAVMTGKLRRYFDLRNFVDIFRVPIGILQAWSKLGRIQPDIVFSKGGFVAVPVVIAAWFRRIPIVIHESDAIPGLATKITSPFARTILVGYKEAKLGKYDFKTKVSGNPVRGDIAKGTKSQAKLYTGFTGKKPVLLVMGGSTGSQQINDMIRLEKEHLTKTYDIIHITGEGKGRKKKEKHYYSIPYAHEELKDFYALASLALSRAGATVLSELESLQLPTLLYPLGTEASRGDQIANAHAMALKHKFFILADESLTASAQLSRLPKRKATKEKSTVAEEIAALLIST